LLSLVIPELLSKLQEFKWSDEPLGRRYRRGSRSTGALPMPYLWEGANTVRGSDPRHFDLWLPLHAASAGVKENRCKKKATDED
jgi:hypothetical protein